MTPTKLLSRRTLAVIILLAGIGWATTVASSTALKFDLDSLVINSNRIVVADVTQMRPLRKEGRIYTETTLEVRETWKGNSAEKVTVRLPGGRMGDTITRVHGLPGFEPGERVVVFLKRLLDEKSRDTPTAFTVTGLRQGKFHVALGPDSSTEFVVPRLNGLRLVAPQDESLTPGDLDDQMGPTARDSGDTQPQDAPSPNLQVAEPAQVHEQVLALEDFRQRVRKRLPSKSTSEPSKGGEQ